MTTWYQISFLTRQYAKIGYFQTLTFISTIVPYLVMFTVARYGEHAGSSLGGGGSIDENLWLRAAVIGMWASCTGAGGILAMARNQGTLAPLLTGKASQLRMMILLVSGPAVFGLSAFPIAWIINAVFTFRLAVPPLISIAGIALLWLSAFSMTFLIATLFASTRDAIAYEPLIALPITLISGVFQSLTEPTFWSYLAALAIPTRGAIYVLLSGHFDFWQVFLALVSCLLWFSTAALALRYGLRRARVEGNLDVY